MFCFSDFPHLLCYLCFFEFPCFPCVLCLSAFSLYSVFSVFSVFSPIFIFPQTLPCVIKRFPLTTGRKTTTTCVENVLMLTPGHAEHDVLPLTPTPEFSPQDKPGRWRGHGGMDATPPTPELPPTPEHPPATKNPPRAIAGTGNSPYLRMLSATSA